VSRISVSRIGVLTQDPSRLWTESKRLRTSPGAAASAQPFSFCSVPNNADISSAPQPVLGEAEGSLSFTHRPCEKTATPFRSRIA
jgi:hypothetical protein